MKTITIIALVILVSTRCMVAQTISNQVVASAGTTLTHACAQIEFTVGEPFITTLSHSCATISLGFHQPSLSISTQAVAEEDLQILDLPTEQSRIGDDFLTSVNITAYPNPFTDHITLEVSGFEIIKGRWLVMDMEGSLVGQYPVSDRIMNIDFKYLVPGQYTLLYANETGHVKGSYKVIKQ